jgi:hypothetical protein
VTLLLDWTLGIIGSGAMLAAPMYLVLQPVAAILLRGGWRIAALVPLLLAIPLGLWCLAAFADQSNLWPVPFLLFAPFGTIYLVIVLLLRWKQTPAT